MSCSRTTTQWSRWGSNPRPLSLESTLYHWATALPLLICACLLTIPEEMSLAMLTFLRLLMCLLVSWRRSFNVPPSTNSVTRLSFLSLYMTPSSLRTFGWSRLLNTETCKHRNHQGFVKFLMITNVFACTANLCKTATQK